MDDSDYTGSGGFISRRTLLLSNWEITNNPLISEANGYVASMRFMQTM